MERELVTGTGVALVSCLGFIVFGLSFSIYVLLCTHRHETNILKAKIVNLNSVIENTTRNYETVVHDFRELYRDKARLEVNYNELLMIKDALQEKWGRSQICINQMREQLQGKGRVSAQDLVSSDNPSIPSVNKGSEIVEVVRIDIDPPMVPSPFEPLLMNPMDSLVFVIFIFFVFTLLTYVVIRAAKTLLRTNNFVRINSIDNTSVSQEHPYHLVDPSPWPLLGSLGALTSTIGAVMYMHSFTGDKILLTLGLGLILYTMFVWWRDVTCESTYEGNHTKVV